MRRLPRFVSVLTLALAVVAAAVLGLGGLHLYHWWLLDLAGMEQAVAAKLARAEALRNVLGERDQQAILEALGPNPWSGEAIRLDERLAEARIVPASAAALPAPEFVRGPAFHFEGDDAVRLLPEGAGHRIEDGVLVIDAWKGDTLLSWGDLQVAMDDVAEIEVRIRLARGRGFRIGWSPIPIERWPDKAKKKQVGFLDVDAVEDGEFHVYRIDARHSLRYRLVPGDVIRSFLLLPSDTPQDRVEIDFVRFVLRREQYQRAPSGLTHETFEGELRPAVYAMAPSELRWELAVPSGEPRLDFGMAILERVSPLRFSVLVEDGEGQSEVFEQHIDAAERWHDARVDLAEWAGERIGLVLRVSGSGGNVAFWASPRVSTRPKQRLHVLMILEDAMRADRLSLYGHERETSPFKDRLALRGTLFEHAFSQATKTRPSCPSFMTSLYPTATGVWSFRDRLDDRFLTLAEVLRSQGFETASFIQNTNAGPAAGLHQGFDHFWNAHSMGNRPEQIYGDHVLRWIADRLDRNLFAYLHVLDPHGVFDPPAPYDRWYREDDGDAEVRPYYGRLDPEWVERPTREGRENLYDGEIRHNDWRLETFIDALGRLGVLEDTLLVFLSDHGEHFGEHAVWIHKPPGFVQVLHVPLLMVHPRLLPQGVRLPGPVQLADVAPTILELAGVDVERLPLQGSSLLPLVRAQAPADGEMDVAVSEEATSYSSKLDPSVRASLFSGRWHFLRTEQEGRTSLQIFDYLADPEELKPLATASMDLLLQRRVLGWLTRLKSANLAIWEQTARGDGEEVRFDPAVQDQLRALGYIE